MNYGISNLSIIPVRKDPSEKSEMVTQILFGEHFELREQMVGWTNVKLEYDGYEGWVDNKQIYSLLEEEPITLGLAKEVLKDLLKEPKRLITVDFIQRCVSEEFGISLHELKTRRRNKNIVLPRQVAMYLSRELTELSLPEIGDDGSLDSGS